MKRFLIIFALLMLLVVIGLRVRRPHPVPTVSAVADQSFGFQSIDTMKYSRDMSRSKLHSTSFDAVIEQQVSAIAATGATHVAIATPYDDEFLPMLQRWVDAARRHHLHVWFRGNWSGWEGWFDYPSLTRAEHITKTKQFILDHPGLFSDGDVFTGCPECENGGPGDPRQTGDVTGYRRFLIDEYGATNAAFTTVGKKVASNYDSMNADVARLIMDRATTSALDGVVTIDHYVKTPEQLDQDITAIAAASGGRIVLGEWGTPVPDIHGEQTEEVQAEWMNDALQRLTKNPHLIGLNYWVNVGGSTSLWNSEGQPRSAVSVLHDWYQPRMFTGTVKDQAGTRLNQVTIRSAYSSVTTDADGQFQIPLSTRGETTLTISATNYAQASMDVSRGATNANIALVPQQQHLGYRLRRILYSLNPWK